MPLSEGRAIAVENVPLIFNFILVLGRNNENVFKNHKLWVAIELRQESF